MIICRFVFGILYHNCYLNFTLNSSPLCFVEVRSASILKICLCSLCHLALCFYCLLDCRLLRLLLQRSFFAQFAGVNSLD
ncbi:hypothetical protein L6452_11278 [Arctium lappa]|uniref:Uncharacterized protein n=1 Tax=Arctium lappa TaxID=4217 RepID=A0ACB9DNS1_ARCLA|nr:hypothetical protein L6452_11278 [Arctium lappa]